ncbi:hypothetical protein BDN67DRAFT_991589 [Paxillus ammoniavirescens]|nr:hypothetical protein BDN67DRAFT_991589 [Paxillus ammoniavirescens]
MLTHSPFHPYPNESSLWLGDWYWNYGLQKSQESFKNLLDIIGDLDFNLEDIQNMNWKAIDKALGSSLDNGPEASHGWICSPITILTLSNLLHHNWHLSSRNCDVRVYGELYTSEAFIKAQDQLLASPHEPGLLMFWLNATQLTSFGNAKLWPLYLYFGNQSNSKLCSHVTYFQSGKPNDALLTHCHRELFHAQWCMLLDDKFLEAYEHGIVITCQDEVVLIVTIRNLGKCPCPRCLILKSRVHLLATKLDILECETLSCSDTAQRHAKVISAHKLIYESNYAVDGTCVEELLKDESLVPTLNTFSEKVGHTGFDLFLMLITDLLHEFELGVWKAICIHLLQILKSVE